MQDNRDPGMPLSRLTAITLLVGLAPPWLTPAASAFCYSDHNGLAKPVGRPLVVSQSIALTRKLVGHRERISSIAFAPGGRILVTGSRDATVRVWDGQTGVQRSVLSGHRKDVKLVAFGLDGRVLVTVGRDDTPRLWNANTGELKAALTGHKDSVWVAKFSPDGKRLLTASGDKSVRLWDVETGRMTAALTGHKSFSVDGYFSPDGGTVLSASLEDRAVRLWDASTGQLKLTLSVPKSADILNHYTPYVFGARFSPDGVHVAVSDSHNRIALWDAQTGTMLALWEAHASSIYDLEFSPDGTLLASASRDGTAKLWDGKTGRLRSTFKSGPQIARRVQFSADGKTLAVAFHSRAGLWDVSTGEPIGAPAQQEGVNRSVFFGTYMDGAEVTFSPDSRVLLTMSAKSVKAWNARTCSLIGVLENARPPVAFSPDGRMLATASSDKSALLWEISSP